MGNLGFVIILEEMKVTAGYIGDLYHVIIDQEKIYHIYLIA